MKKIFLIIIFFLFLGALFPISVLAEDPIPTPTIEPIPTGDEVCSGTIYPPNSKCHAPIEKVEAAGINLFDSNQGFLTYPLSCISAPTVTYSETYTDFTPPPSTRTINVSTNFSEAQLGFLGPDSTTLATSNPDDLAKKYLFNALFDRPSTDPNAAKESFRTFWRMLDNMSQAQLKAYYLEHVTNHTYYYVGSDYKQHEVKISDLKNKLPSCLKKFGSDPCWANEKYVDEYLSLDQTTKDEYDALLPFNFENMRGYLSDGNVVSSENIPYLQAIISGLKGYRDDFLGIPNTVIPGLFDYYTPDWATRNLALYPTLPLGEKILSLQYPILQFVASLNNNCEVTSNSSSLSSPKTYANPSDVTQSVTIPISSVLKSSEPDRCSCPPGDYLCYIYVECTSFANSQTSCVNNGCVFTKGADTYALTGTATGKPITVFNNPYITSLTDLVMGGKPLITNVSQNGFSQAVINIINSISDRLISPVQPSFYKMLLPDFASKSGDTKTLIGAPTVNTTTDNPNATVQGSNAVYRENDLAQSSMAKLQNCWLVPSDQQSSSKCGTRPNVGACDGKRFKEILGDTIISPSSAANSYFNSYILERLSTNVVSAYAAAEEATGVPCEVLAGIHYREGGSEPGLSLQDGRPLSGKTLEESAIQAGEELNGKTRNATSITDLDDLIFALSQYNGGGNTNCQSSTSCPAAAQLSPCTVANGQPQFCCGTTVACASNTASCVCKQPYETDSCRNTCGSVSFPWPIPYNYCTPFPKMGYSDPYVTNLWQSPQNDSMYILFQYDCTQTKPIPDSRPGTLTIALSLYLTDHPNQ